MFAVLRIQTRSTILHLGALAFGFATIVGNASTSVAQVNRLPPGQAPAAAGPTPGDRPPTAPDAGQSFYGPPPSAAMTAFREQLAADVLPSSGDWPSPSPDPRNFEGVWRQYNPLLVVRSSDMFGGPVPLNDKGRALLGKRVAAAMAGRPNLNASAMCIPPGQPLQLEINLPFVVYQNKDWVQFIFEQYHGVWTVVFDPAQQPDGSARTYAGRSSAHWEGNTLVVETTGFKQPLWLDINGTPASANAKFTHRIRKVHQGGTTGDWILEVITTLDDPAYYTRPWSWATSYSWRPDKAPFSEYDCEYQVNRPDYVSGSGLGPEASE